MARGEDRSLVGMCSRVGNVVAEVGRRYLTQRSGGRLLQQKEVANGDGGLARHRMRVRKHHAAMASEGMPSAGSMRKPHVTAFEIRSDSRMGANVPYRWKSSRIEALTLSSRKGWQ